MSKHTPGPWEASNIGVYGDFDGNSIVILGGDIPIRVAVVHINEWAVDEEGAANARLIAKAPEMLEVLRWLLHLAHGVSKGGEDCPVTDQELRQAWDKAKELIKEIENA